MEALLEDVEEHSDACEAKEELYQQWFLINEVRRIIKPSNLKSTPLQEIIHTWKTFKTVKNLSTVQYRC